MRQAGGRLSASLLLRQKCDGAATSRRPVAPERRCPETCPVPPGPRHLRSRLVRRLPGGWSAVAGSTAVATFLSLEGRLRQDAAARSLSAGGGDAGTPRAIGAPLPGGLAGPPLLAAATRRRWPAAIGWSGATLAAVGTTLRLGSAVAPGARYTRHPPGGAAPGGAHPR